MYKLFCGIDGGSYGAISIIDNEGQLIKHIKMPLTIRDSWRTIEEFKQNIEKNEMFGMVEKNHAYPGNGASSAFTFGYNSCLAETILIYNEIPYEKIPPQCWMGYFKMKKDRNESQTNWKNRLYQKTQMLFPKNKFYQYESDAILIAEYCRRKMLNIKFE